MRLPTISTITKRFPKPEWPEFMSIRQHNNVISIELNIYREIRWFEGHFPTQPVLAGVVQTHWAGEIGKYLFPLGDAFTQLDNLKFQNVILPDRQLTLELTYFEDKNNMKFQFLDDTLHYSEGKFIFAL